MYRIVLIDDEKSILEGLKKIIPWHEIDCEVVGCAYNGTQALELIKDEKPDIAIIDIQMPFFNGLSVVKQLYKETNTKFIILSGYSTFEYAQQAIQLGIMGYLLKPVEEDELIDIIQKTILQIESEREVEQNLKNMQDDIQTIQTKTRNYILKEFVNSFFENNEVANLMLSDANLNLTNSYYYVITFQIISEISPSINDFDIISYIETQINQKGIAFRYSNEEIVLIYTPENLLPSITIKNQFRSILTKMKYEYHLLACCGISLAIQCLNEINTAFTQSRFSSIYTTLKIDGCVSLYSEKMSNPTKHAQTIAPALRNDLERSIKLLDYIAIHTNTTKLFKEIKNQNEFALIDLQIYSIQIIMECIKKMYEMGIYYSEETTELFLKITNLCENEIYHKCEYLTSQFITKFEDITKKAQTVRLSRSQSTVEDIKSYIVEHIYDDLSLETISKKFFLSPVYLSQLFKKECGTAYLEFIREIKIKKACELLRSSNHMVFEIAEMVGYKDQKYFSKVFEKITGYTPTDYRKRF